jgi:beta-glucanase (GH16 family)
MDGKGFWAKAPAYFEARFIAQSAPGTWPAFWTITHLDRDQPSDELDIIEAYGGVGKGNASHPGYAIVSHFWGQQTPDKQAKPGFSATPLITKLGGHSSWSTTFHTYGVRVDLTETVYYFDGIEVLRHPTNDISRTKPHCFLLNYAIGGASGWPIDLERYGNTSDMYVDYVRVYAKERISYELPPPKPAVSGSEKP